MTIFGVNSSTDAGNIDDVPRGIGQTALITTSTIASVLILAVIAVLMLVLYKVRRKRRDRRQSGMKSTTLPTGFVFRANTEILENTQITSTEHQSRSPQPCEEIGEENSESRSDSEDDKESDINMDDYDDAASSNIFQTLLKEGPYVEPGFDETLHHEYVLPGQKIVEVDRDRIHKKNLIFSCNLYQQHEGEAWFIGGIDGSLRVIVKSPAGRYVSKVFLLGEISLMRSLSTHKNIISLLGCCTNTDPPYLISERAHYGTLKDFLLKNKEKIVCLELSSFEKQLLTFCIDIARGMEYLTSKKLTHRYLSAKHVNLCHGMVCKVSNFIYSSTVMDNHQFAEQTSNFTDAYPWLALESLCQNTFNSKTDVWSFGVVMWETFNLGKMPYYGFTQSDVIQRLEQGYRLLRPDNCREDIYNIMLPCWRKQQRGRPTFRSVLSGLTKAAKDQLGSEAADVDNCEKVSKPKLENLNFRNYDVQIIESIYKGELREILLAKAYLKNQPECHKRIAIKVFNGDADKLAVFDREIDVMKSIPAHENIIALLTYSSGIEPAYLITEYAQKGNLKSYLTAHRKRLLSHDSNALQKESMSFIHDIASGMNHLTLIGVTHRNLLARNVLVFNGNVCKISNFSYATDLVYGSKMQDLAKKDQLPYQWMAPETLSRWTFNSKTEVWSFGVVVWEIITFGDDPFKGMDRNEVMTSLKRGFRLLKPTHCTDKIYDMILSCWRKEPSDRSTFPQLKDKTKNFMESTDVFSCNENSHCNAS